MTDQIPADKVREIVAAMRAAMRRDEHAYPEAKFLADLSNHIKDLEALLPPRPTLADMTEGERVACRWMQADLAGRDTRYVITRPYDEDDDVALISADGGVVYADPGRVTPRPDLPRMEWPGDKKPAPALPEGWRLADHEKYGRVVVTNTTPDADGHVYFVAPATGPIGNDWHLCAPDELTYIDTGQEADQ